MEGSKKDLVSEAAPPSADAPGKAVSVPASKKPAPWDRLFTFPAVLAVSLAYLVFILARRNIADPDLWWHLRNAKWFLSTGHLPVVDHYSYTGAGHPVLPFEWLSELAYYAAFHWAHLGGVFALVFVLSAAIMLGVFRLSCLVGAEVKNAFLVCVGGAMLSTISIGARTLLFGWLYLVLLLLLLEKVRRGAWKLLWLVPPLFCLWVNSHGSWPLGMVLFAIFIASGMLAGQWGHAYAERWSRPQLAGLLTAAAASATAVFINPFGEELVVYPFRVLFAGGGGSGNGSGGSGVGQIEEFLSVDFHTPWGKMALALIAAVLLAAVFSRVRWRLDEIGFTLVALYYGLTYIRFLFLAGILLPPVLARRVRLLAPYEPETDRRRPNVVALAVLLVLFAVSVPRHGHYENPVQYPEGAVAYMKANGLEGNLFHDWTWGGYLLWHEPQWKVFIDGRGDPYAGRVFQDYLDAKFGANPQPVLDKYHVQLVLMPASSRMAKTLKSDPRWVLRYSDKVSVLFQRAAPPAKG